MIDLDALGSQEMIVGSFMKDGATIANVEAMNTIPKEAFTNPLLRDVFMACKHLTDRAEDMDVIMVDDLITRRNARLGMSAHESQFQRINKLWHDSLKGFSIEAHCRKLIKAYKLRLAKQSMIEVSNAIEYGTDVDEVVNTVEKLISSLRMDGATYQTQHISDLVAGYADHLDAKTGELGIRTGFEQCDKLLGRVSPGNMIVISARSGQGKTEFACDWAVNAAINQGKNILVFSLEMDNGEIMDRFVAIEADISTSSLDNPLSLDTDGWGGGWAKVTAALSKLQGGNISVHDEPGISLSKIRQVVKETERKTGKLDAIIIDYLQLIRDPSAKSRLEEVSAVSRGIKEMAKDFKLPIIALAQLNRECEKQNREPKTSDIRECGQIEMDADKIIFLHCPNKNEPSEPNYQLSKAIFAKVRQGKTGAAVLEFRGGHFYDTMQQFNEEDEGGQSDNQASKYVGKRYSREG